jgi:aryl-alcohol dehydrogenase-like predicted oxidoreductase
VVAGGEARFDGEKRRLRTAMIHSAFGNTGLSVSSLGFGAGPIGYLGTEQERVTSIVNLLLDHGVNVIDTAAAYEGSEEALGKAVASRRDEYVLISKCGQSFPDLPGAEWSPEVITATVDRSLQRLKTDHLDVMLLHSCSQEVLEAGEALGALVRARDAGKIRFVGYSGDNAEAAYAARLPDVRVIETSVNICDQANIDTVLPLTEENEIGVIAKRPVANSAWRPVDSLPGIYSGYARPYRERFEKMGLSAADLGFHEDDWAEIALRFTLSQPGVNVAIIGTTNPRNAQRNVAAAAKGKLPEEVIAKIREAFTKAESKSGETWEGLT